MHVPQLVPSTDLRHDGTESGYSRVRAHKRDLQVVALGADFFLLVTLDTWDLLAPPSSSVTEAATRQEIAHRMRLVRTNDLRWTTETRTRLGRNC
jgi:hypothetical protein